jgi:hypothetical protein
MTVTVLRMKRSIKMIPLVLLTSILYTTVRHTIDDACWWHKTKIYDGMSMSIRYSLHRSWSTSMYILWINNYIRPVVIFFQLISFPNNCFCSRYKKGQSCWNSLWKSVFYSPWSSFVLSYNNGMKSSVIMFPGVFKIMLKNRWNIPYCICQS